MTTKAYKYLIVGGGMTADAAAHAIRERDPEGSIAVLCGEPYPPYDRPPLSKKLWTGEPLESIWRNTERQTVELILGRRAVKGDAAAKTVTDDQGQVYRYEKLLLATGGAPRRLPGAAEGVIYFRDLDDYQKLRALADRKAEFVVIGGGFIGSEVAAALAMNDCKVTMVFPGDAIGGHIYPPALAEFINGYFREKGVEVLTGEKIEAVEKEDTRYAVRTAGGRQLSADSVIAGIGIVPEVDLAESLGLTVDNGIRVDEQLRAAPDIYAAGDVANFYCPPLGVRRRVEHEDNVYAMGAVAGHNMAGADEHYDHLPFFYSDLFDLGYEAVGELGSGMDIVEDWVEPFRQGVVYYLKEGRVRGVLLWNTWDQVDNARALIAGGEAINAEALVGRIR